MVTLPLWSVVAQSSSMANSSLDFLYDEMMRMIHAIPLGQRHYYQWYMNPVFHDRLILAVRDSWAAIHGPHSDVPPPAIDQFFGYPITVSTKTQSIEFTIRPPAQRLAPDPPWLRDMAQQMIPARG